MAIIEQESRLSQIALLDRTWSGGEIAAGRKACLPRRYGVTENKLLSSSLWLRGDGSGATREILRSGCKTPALRMTPCRRTGGQCLLLSSVALWLIRRFAAGRDARSTFGLQLRNFYRSIKLRSRRISRAVPLSRMRSWPDSKAVMALSAAPVPAPVAAPCLPPL